MLTLIVFLLVTFLVFWFLPRDIKKVKSRDLDINLIRLQHRFKELRDHFAQLVPAAKQAGVELGKLKGSIQQLRGDIIYRRKGW